MIGNNILHVSQSKSESLHVVQVSGMNTVKLVENLLQIFLLDTNAIILNGDVKFA